MKKQIFFLLLLLTAFVLPGLASEADLVVPALEDTTPAVTWNGFALLFYGSIIGFLGLLFGYWQYTKIKKLEAHQSMLDISNVIYETAKTYLTQQGKFLAILFALVGTIIVFYFAVLVHMEFLGILSVLLWAVLGMAGSYGVAWFGIRINTLANSRTAFASLKGKYFDVMRIPLQSGMSIGILLISVELIMMLAILLFVDGESAGACFVGFAIGESLGASALRIAGGIFTKIADIGADLMKIIFTIGEDDPRNPGVIADCVGDNAGDSVGPTADGFETYGVTGVALISFIILAIPDAQFQAVLISWIFVMRLIMLVTSIASYEINHVISKAKYGSKTEIFDFEVPLTNLIWIGSSLSIAATYAVSYFLLGGLEAGLWWKLSTIISMGTLAAALIPELTKIFTSSKSAHVQEIVVASKEGGASLNILSGLVAGNFSAIWIGFSIVGLMFVGYEVSADLSEMLGGYPAVFAFGLIAFGLLGMGPITIAVDSYGPVTDNAQSVFELSQIESIPNITQEIERDFGFTPNFEKGKKALEANDSAGNTFKATAKPVLIATAVIGATTMIFSIILMLKKTGLLAIELTDPQVLMGFIAGGSVIFWFSGAAIQAVTTGAYRAVTYIKQNINLNKAEADINDSKAVVQISTQYAQQGMWNIFFVIFSLTLAFAFFDPNFFVAYLISIAAFGLFQAIFMANAGGSWDNAKKVVEVDLNMKGTPLHAAAVVGDTVGDPYKDTSSVSLNPIIKFSTLFGLLATEISIELIIHAQDTGGTNYGPYIGAVFFLVGMFFVWRSFYGMRIPKDAISETKADKIKKDADNLLLDEAQG